MVNLTHLMLVFLFSIANAGEYLVGVYYYPWYHSDGRHWNEGYLRDVLTIQQPPLLGEYSSRDTSAIQSHIVSSLNNGIEFWVISWWGPSSWEDVTIGDYILPTISGTGMKWCILYETPGCLGTSPPFNFDSPALRNKLISDFEYLASTYFGNQNYLYINDRPVVLLYLTREFTGDYQTALSEARTAVQNLGYNNPFIVGDEVYWGNPNQTRISCMDAITAYNMHGPTQYAGYAGETNFLKDVSARYSTYKNVANPLGVYLIPAAMPGFNDRAVRPAEDHYVIPNQYLPLWDHTTMLRRSLITAKIYEEPSISNPILITSWNEWHEDTQVEPTIVTGGCNTDTSASGSFYTQNYTYVGYGIDQLKTVHYVVGNGETTLFYTGFENGHPYPYIDSCIEKNWVDGYGGAPYPEAGRVSAEMGVPVEFGSYYLRVAGEDISSTQNSFCYYILYDFNPDIPIDKATFLRYRIYPYQKQHEAIDFVTTDGVHLRNSGCIDQSEISIHPEGRSNPTGQWQYIEVDLYPLAGKIIDYLTCGYDDNPNSEIGNYRFYIDEISIVTKGEPSIGIKSESPQQNQKAWRIIPSLGRFFQIKTTKSCNVAIYNAAGRFVKKLFLQNGIAFWNGTDEANQSLPEGVYFVKRADFNSVAKIVLIH